ncbi:MAG: hypothetical protein DMG39_12560 [Acidobacteria bacterium]|nr:MAG: hypothetical protein DMG39_12560 [Acidobacteriota bacterium]
MAVTSCFLPLIETVTPRVAQYGTRKCTGIFTGAAVLIVSVVPSSSGKLVSCTRVTFLSGQFSSEAMKRFTYTPCASWK